MPVSSERDESRQAPPVFWLGLLLVIFTFVLFQQVRGYDFVSFDDPVYITENPEIHDGLTWSNVAWAFTSTHASFWHPLTWLSLMLDCQVYGLNPGGHHFSNLLLHILNTLALFLVLHRLTGACWRSALVAALFAVHPLHVESVAWVSQRKDTLSTLFWILSMGAYGWYAERPGWKRYVAFFALYVLGLMAKPMLVTLPFVFLLLDYWPLRRLDGQQAFARKGARLLAEKAPMFAVAIVFCAVAVYGQRSSGALRTLEQSAFLPRVANAVVAYGVYLIKMVWPTRMALFYPRPLAGYALWQVLGSLALLVAISAVCFALTKRRPYLLVGWLWYLGTLVPVSGLVQVGEHAFADRYTYVPLIGVFIMIAWTIPAALGATKEKRTVLAACVCLVLAALSVVAWRQIGFWKDSRTLYEHALEVTSDNRIAHYNLANTLLDEDELEAARNHYQATLALKPDHVKAHVNLGVTLAKLGNAEAAEEQFQEAIALAPRHFSAYSNLAQLLGSQGRWEEAAQSYEKALEILPDDTAALFRLGLVRLEQGQKDKGRACLLKVLEIEPDHAQARQALAMLDREPPAAR